MNNVSIFSTQKKFRKYEKTIVALSRRVLSFLRKNNLFVDFFLVSREEIRLLNKDYRKKDKETNVLSFCEPKDFIQPENKFKKMGEIYLSLDFIKENQQDTKLMVVHGILHLLGYDHIKEKDRIKMEKKEAEVLSKI